MKKIIQTLLGGAILILLPFAFTSCEDILGEWSKPAPAVSSVTKSTGNVCFATTSLLRGSLDPSFTNALTLTGDGTVTYASSDPAVATVDPATGKVTPVAPGTATITATISDSETYTYATKQASYTLELQEGYSYRSWDETEKKFVVNVAASDGCELITSTTIDNGKIHVVKGTVNITGDIYLNGTILNNIILCDNSVLNISGRLIVPSSYPRLIILAQSDSDDMGQLNVSSSTGSSGVGVIGISSDLEIHGGKITATALGSSPHMFGIQGKNITIYGGDIKAQGNEAGGSYSTSGILGSISIAIHGGKVEAIGGDVASSSSSNAGHGISGRFTIDGDAVVIAKGGNASGTGNGGGHGIWNNNEASTIGGHAKVTLTGGNSSSLSPGAGMEITSATVTLKDYAQVTATGGDHLGTNYYGTAGIHNGYLTLQDQASLTAIGGKSSGNINGVYGIASLNYYGGTFMATGGEKGPSAANDGNAIYNLYNQTTSNVTFEKRGDGETWIPFDISAGANQSPTARYVRKAN